MKQLEPDVIVKRKEITKQGNWNRLSLALPTTCETRRKTSAIRGQKFHTDDINEEKQSPLLHELAFGFKMAAKVAPE